MSEPSNFKVPTKQTLVTLRILNEARAPMTRKNLDEEYFTKTGKRNKALVRAICDGFVVSDYVDDEVAYKPSKAGLEILDHE